MKKFIFLIHIIIILNILKLKNFNKFNIYKILYFNKNKLVEKIWNNYYFDINNKNIIFKYNNNYTTRSYIDLNKEKIIIETIDNNSISVIKDEIKKIFNKNIYEYFIKNNKNIKNKNEFKNKIKKYNFFLNKLKNNINNFLPLVDFNIIENNINFYLKSKYIKINLISNDKIFFLDKYIKYINKISNKYNIDYILILSIIDVESNFDPYSISKNGAIGLMQIIQNKSGLDVFKMLNKTGIPNINYLFNIKNNIKIGCIYIFILQNNYLYKIKNKESLRYITIASYNGGVSSVLKIFSNNNNESIKFINSIKPKDVYYLITNNHPSLEIQEYVKKVNELYNSYKLKYINNL